TAPMADVMADLKRRSDTEKRRADQERERKDYYDRHRESFRTARIKVTRALLRPGGATPAAPMPKDIERWYAAHGRSLFEGALPASSPLPPLSDSLRAVARERSIAGARAGAVRRSG